MKFSTKSWIERSEIHLSDFDQPFFKRLEKVYKLHTQP